MRLAAYKKAIDETQALPTSIPEFKSYFGKQYSPRRQAVTFILKTARQDEAALFPGEFVQLYNYAMKEAT